MTRIDVYFVGAGLTNATIYQQMKRDFPEINVVFLERRNHIGGNCYTKEIDGIDVHKYGAHIFRTDKKEIWDFVNQFHEFNQFAHKVVVNYNNELYSFPINLMTLNKLHPEITTPKQVSEYFETHCTKIEDPKNLEEQATNLIGKELYEIFVKGYTEKQWGRPCTEIPASVIKRIPVRTVANDKYFDNSKKWEGIPAKGGYSAMIEKMLEGAKVLLVDNCDTRFIKNLVIQEDYEFGYTPLVICSGAIDEMCGYEFGHLEWRSLKFEELQFNEDFYQAAPVVNFPASNMAFTRIIEHKQFNPHIEVPNKTIVTFEYPLDWTRGVEPYYPVRDQKSMELLQKYQEYAATEMKNWHFVGRLGQYAYYDMDVAIEKAIDYYKSNVYAQLKDSL